MRKSPITQTAHATAQAEYRTAVARWIDSNRGTLKLSAEELAALIGVTAPSIRNWERGRGNISSYHLDALRNVFRAKWAEYERRAALTPQAEEVRATPRPRLRRSPVQA